MTDHIVLAERFAIADVELCGFSGGPVVYKDIGDGIIGSGLRLSFGVDRVLNPRLLHLQVEVFHLAFIEAVETNFRAVG